MKELFGRMRRGSVLIWSLIAIFILTLLVAGSLLLVSSRQQQNASGRMDTQAYYTASSVTKAMADWIVDENASDPSGGKTSADFLNWLQTQEGGTASIDIPQTELPLGRGTCRVTFTLGEEDDAGLLIETTAEYAQSAYTIKVAMSRSGFRLPDFSFPVPDFETAEYDAEADALNNIPTAGFADDYLRRAGIGIDAIIADEHPAFEDAYGLGHVLPEVGEEQGAPFNHLTEDREILGRLVTDAMSAVEATYDAAPQSLSLSFEETGDMRVTGTRDSISNNLRTTGLADFSNAYFASGLNGRLAVNPERAVGTASGAAYHSEDGDAPDNTKLNNFRVDDTAGKPQMRIRLTEEAGAGTSQAFRGAFVNFDFTDNAETEAESVGDREGNVLLEWYPQNWNGARIFTRGENRNEGEKVDVDLLFGPYAHTYQYGSLSSALDFNGWGLYANRSFGREEGALARLVPQLLPLNGYTAETQPGMPIVPVCWGRDVGLYLLDGDVRKSAWVMQGVNILDGVVYSYRNLILGGSLTAEGHPMTGRTVEGYNSTVPGYSDGTTHDRAVYTNFIPRFNQTIADTDIVLLAPGVEGDDRRASVVKSPSVTPADTLLSKEDMEKAETLLTKDFSVFRHRRTDIIGGTVYIGSGHDLTIEGVARDGTSVFDASPAVKKYTQTGDYTEYTVEGTRLNVSPDRIIVSDDATLTVEASAYRTVDTDIYVSGGALTLRAGANIRGNIYCYGGGSVVIEGDITMDAPLSLLPDTEKSGIYVYGSGAVGTDGEERGKGDVAIPAGTIMYGNAGGIHYLGDDFSDERYAVCVCGSPAAESHRCGHFGIPTRGWRIGRYEEG
ncbi:MAG: hypothetical protein LBO81_02870 [Clostridiales Family XIII bacterium]|jgi:hypothetical protein|nr:hypothetical protein [Clostridiales Family XIII bacterium]